METIISLLIASAITWLISRWYYQKAAEDLQKESAELRDVTAKMWERLQGMPPYAKPSAPSA